MLSRVAENLYWMGRYLERTEHLSRYINVEYFSSLDGAHPRQHELAILSIADMIGLPKPEMSDNINEEEILVAAALDDKNPVSISSALFASRENARSVRDSISSELWFAINDYHLFVSQYPVDVYKTRGLSDFTNNVIQNCSNVRGRIQYSLMHDVGWHFIQLGLQLESASQIVRIMISKLTDIEEIGKLELGESMQAQQWDILLDCIEAKDMCKKFYSSPPSRTNTVEFLLFNTTFPRSVLSRLLSAIDCLVRIDKKNKKGEKGIQFKIAKLVAPYQFMEIEDVTEDLAEFLETLLKTIYSISDLVAEEYFS